MAVPNPTSALVPLGLVQIEEIEVYFATSTTVIAVRTAEPYTRLFKLRACPRICVKNMIKA
jgi:hypothetical protein